MISTVKSRRLMSMQAKKEKEELERQNKGEQRFSPLRSARCQKAGALCSSPSERMEKEAEEERTRRQKAAAERAFQDGVAKAKLVLRRTPLGTDRNHNRSELCAACRRLGGQLPIFVCVCVIINMFVCFSKKDTGFFLTWFLACTSRKAGFTRASSIASLPPTKTQRILMRRTKWTPGQMPLIIPQVWNPTVFDFSDLKYNRGSLGRI